MRYLQRIFLCGFESFDLFNVTLQLKQNETKGKVSLTIV